MVDLVILFTDEALEHFVEANMFNLTQYSKKYIIKHRGNPDLHFYLTEGFTSVCLVIWKEDDDLVVTLDRYCAWSILPTSESRQAYLACMSPSDS